MDTNLAIVLMLVFMGLSAFFSSSETAFFNLQSVRLHHLVETGSPKARRVARLKDQPERFLATLLLGNNVVNTALTAIATSLAISLMEGREELGVVTATIAVTFAVVVFGEAAPKTLAARHAERVAFTFIRPWEVLERVLFPLALVLYGISGVLIHPFQRGERTRPLVSGGELRTMVRIGEVEGTVEQTQAEIIHKALGLGDLQAQEVMTPRTEITWVQRDATVGDFWRTYAEETHTRFPVIAGDPDDVVGILHLKDIVKAFVEGAITNDASITPFIREAHFFPETKPVDDLFVEMRNTGTQIGMLVNEYGGIAGLLTMKQIVGEVVGRITEEEGEPEVEAIDERTYQVDASIRIEEANERLSLGLPDGDYETLAGFMLTSLGHIPREGEQVRLDGLRLVITEMKGVKIERVLVTRS